MEKRTKEKLKGERGERKLHSEHTSDKNSAINNPPVDRQLTWI
jgi:hypothetical protein